MKAGSAAGAGFAFSGSLSATSASSPVTSSTRTVSGSGTAKFDGVAGSDPEYSLNGGAWTNITEGLTLVLANGDTLAVRETVGLPSSATFNILDNATSALVQMVTLTRT